jgi:hypothetical protein
MKEDVQKYDCVLPLSPSTFLLSLPLSHLSLSADMKRILC